MFEFRNPPVKNFASRHLGISAISLAARLTDPIARVVNSVLKFKGNFDFISFDNAERLNLSQKLSGGFAGNYPTPLRPMFFVFAAMVVGVDSPAEVFAKQVDERSVCHSDHQIQAVSYLQLVSRRREFPDANASFAVKESCDVFDFQHVLSCVVNEKLVNSVETRCPARRGAEGQYRAKQERHALGVCNEQVPTAKAKVCSELHGNMQTSAEMIEAGNVLHSYKVRYQVTDCNSNYMFWRPHKDRNIVPLDDGRFSVNQDAMVKLVVWAGNLTTSGRQFQAVLAP